MTGHDDIRELIPVVALNAASADEVALVERHAATCHECRAELDSSRAAAAQLAVEVPQVDPPPELKRKVMDTIREQPAARRSAPRPAPTRRWLGPRAWPALAGAFAVLALGMVAWNVTLRGGDGPREIAVSGTGAGVTGRLLLDDDGTAVLRVAGLPALPADHGYELWTIRAGGAMRSEGFAARTRDGEIVVATADLEGATALAITPEPRANTAAPTDQPVVVVSLDAT